jgi:hypothetical protein
MKNSRAFSGVLPLMVVLVVCVAIAGCGHETDELIENDPPIVQITGGPLNQSTDSYTARIFWTGWDEDGIITHFQYALDPPPEFSEEEIGNPEDFDAITMIAIPGPTEFQDTLRVSKVVDGEIYTFDWVQTREFSRAFAFETPNPDSVQSSGSTPEPGDTFSGLHELYVRAQDNDENFSDLAFVSYTAQTFIPESEITRPEIQTDILLLGSTLNVTWDGLDPDSPDPNKKPTGYLYRLLRLDTLEPPIEIIFVGSPKILYEKGDVTWTYQSAETTSVILQLGVPGKYVFGVRAVDVAGAEEARLNFGRNAFKFQAFATGGKPDLTIREPAVGTFAYRGIGAPQEGEAATGQVLFFHWTASAEAYGGQIEAFSWGIDIPDLDVEGPGSGWSGWGLTDGNFEPIIFNRAGIHVLYVRVRDIAGTITLGTLVLNVIEFTFDKELLFVDDSFDDLYPRDHEQDGFWREMIDGYGAFSPEQIGELHAHLDNDRGALSPIPPLLEDLGRYKMVLWDCRGSGYNGTSAFLKVTGIAPTLSGYLGAGGKLWVSGRLTVAATDPDPTGLRANLVYPKEELGPGNFAWDFLKLHSTRINNDKGLGQVGKNNLYNVKPYPNRPTTYERMDVDLTKLNPAAVLRGVSHADAIFDPLFAHSEPNFRGTIDSLYIYGATGPDLLDPPRSSSYQNRLTALRWHDPDPDRRRHGRVQWFGFPMYFFFNNQAQDTFNRSMDWFREETIPTP